MPRMADNAEALIDYALSHIPPSKLRVLNSMLSRKSDARCRDRTFCRRRKERKPSQEENGAQARVEEGKSSDNLFPLTCALWSRILALVWSQKYDAIAKKQKIEANLRHQVIRCSSVAPPLLLSTARVCCCRHCPLSQPAFSSPVALSRRS
jgi:hypothetical protein